MTSRCPISRDTFRTAVRLAASLAAVAAAQPSAVRAADGRMLYGNATTTPQARAYSALSNAFGAAAAAGAAAATNPTHTVVRTSATRNEAIAGHVTTGGVLHVLRWNGSAWSNEWNVTVGGDGVNGRRFDVAYEGSSGNAMVVYSNNANGSMSYRTWNGTAWTAATAFTSARATTIPSWIKLLPRPGATNEIALTVVDNGTTAGNASRLSTLVWSGTAWGNEPAAAHSTTFPSTTGQLVQNDAFEMAWETQSGILWVFWTNGGTTANNRRSLSAARPTGTWATTASFGGTARAVPGQWVAASDPNSNNILVAFNSGTGVYASMNAGGTWETQAARDGATTPVTPAVNKKTIAAQWLVDGGTSYAVLMWGTSTAGTLGYTRATVSGTTATWATEATQVLNGTTSWGWMDAQVDPFVRNTLMLTYSDGAASPQLWAKRLVVTAGPTFTFTNADGGATLGTVTNSTTQAFSFAYDRLPITLTVGNGTDPANSTISWLQSAALDAFTLTTASSTASPSSITVTLGGTGAPAAVASLSIQNTSACNMATPYGQLTAGIVSGANTIPVTGLTASTTDVPLWICMVAAQTAAAQTVTGRVTAVVAPGFGATLNDTTGATVTVNPPPSVTIATGTDPAGTTNIAVDGLAVLDAFTLTAASGTATPSTIRVTVTNPAALKNVFITNSSVCTGATNYGTVTSPAASPVDIPVSGLSVGTTAVSLYLCGTGAQVGTNTTVTPAGVTSVTASGYGSTGSSTNGSRVVTVTPPPNVAIATGTDQTALNITADGVAKLDGFTLTASSGTATISSVTVTFAAPANPTALQSVFIMSGTACTGGTNHGSRASPSASTTVPLTGLTVGVTAVALSVCGTGGLVAATTQVAPSVTVTAVAAPGYVQGTAGDTAGAAVVNVTAPTQNLTIANGSGTPGAGPLAYAYPPPVGVIDLFTLQAPAAGTAITSITASVTSTVGTAVKNVFVNSTPACTGTTYGTIGGTGGIIPISGLTVGTTATTLYLCFTAGMTATAATVSGGTVTAARAAGLGSTGTSTGGTNVTVNPPTQRPTVSIVTPQQGKVVSAAGAGYQYRVQARVALSTGIPGTTPNNITAVQLSTDNGATYPVTMTQNANYNSGSPTVTATLYEATVTNPSAATGLVLRARVTTTAVPAPGVVSEPVTINVVAGGTGDGNLLVRDNADQLCSDCHALQTHSSEDTGLQYNSWGVQCRDCHSPHGTRNIFLVRESITPPSLGGATPAARNVGFTRQTGDSGAPGWDTANNRPAATASYANSDNSGPCQVCHTRTASPAGVARFRNTGNPDTGHYAAPSTIKCTSCHQHKGGFKGGDCIACHSSQQPIAAGPLAGTGQFRRAVVLEFQAPNAWSHKRSGGFNVTADDCVVCHMEGASGGGPDAAFHMNGYIELRDPDTGSQIQGVTFTDAAGASPGSYASNGTPLRFERFSRDLNSTTLEPAVQAIMINQCLKCHDSNGAQASFVPGGSPEKPFGTTIAGAAYTGAGVTANGVLGGVTDVNAAFATTNSSYHPIRGKQNNWYAKLTRMAAPWSAATANRGATVDQTSWGWLLSCWDCHATPTDAGVITRTVTAHGGTATIRGVATVTGTPAATTNQVTFCIKCHAGYDSSTANNHSTGSAITSSTNSTMTTYFRYGCNICHGSGYTTAVARPIRAIDVHGVNALPAGGLAKTTRWAGTSTGTPAQVDARPYGFIRDTEKLTNHSPARIGGSTYTATCTGGNSSPCSNSMGSYTTGGTY